MGLATGRPASSRLRMRLDRRGWPGPCGSTAVTRISHTTCSTSSVPAPGGEDELCRCARPSSARAGSTGPTALAALAPDRPRRWPRRTRVPAPPRSRRRQGQRGVVDCAGGAGVHARARSGREPIDALGWPATVVRRGASGRPTSEPVATLRRVHPTQEGDRTVGRAGGHQGLLGAADAVQPAIPRRPPVHLRHAPCTGCGRSAGDRRDGQRDVPHIAGGAVRRRLEELGEPPGAALTATVPAALPKRADRFGNSVTTLYVSLHSDVTDRWLGSSGAGSLAASRRATDRDPRLLADWQRYPRLNGDCHQVDGTHRAPSRASCLQPHRLQRPGPETVLAGRRHQ